LVRPRRFALRGSGRDTILPSFSVVLLIDMQQFKREDPFCLALLFPFPLLFRSQASGGVPEKSGMTHITLHGGGKAPEDDR
jgi:hypothetical protein